VFRTIPPPPNRLLVFARLPERGSVKTRLARTLGDDRALAVYQAMLRDLLASLAGSRHGSDRDTEIEVMWAPTPAANGAALKRAFGDVGVAMQTGATLGDRLCMAFAERFIFHRTLKIIAVGVDDPRLTRETIDHAFALLDSCDWVIGPARDGGYYLIGCRAGSFDAGIFEGIEWGSDAVLAATLEKIPAWQATVALLPLRYDIDQEEDLRRFAGEGGEGEVARLLREWGWAA
jgi:rSAM/selenodomain-associated transferase 1